MADMGAWQVVRRETTAVLTASQRKRDAKRCPELP